MRDARNNLMAIDNSAGIFDNMVVVLQDGGTEDWTRF